MLETRKSIVFSLVAVIKANYLCNELGLDTLEAGIAIATAMELAEKGYIPEDEYYQLRGWDTQGRPTAEKLRELGLA